MMTTATTSSYTSYHQKIFLDAVRCGDTVRLRRLLETDLPGEGEPAHGFPGAGQPVGTAHRRPPASTSVAAAATVEVPVNVNVYSSDGQTALHQSCRAGNLELVKLLVSHGADVRLANRDGWSALHIAVGAGHQDVARYLLRVHRR
jgi:Ankyrin repeats (3 copies)